MKKKKNMVKPLYTILLLYEDVCNPESDVELEDYLAYLDRTSLLYIGAGYDEIYHTIKGLKFLKDTATHRIVKSSVFHMIGVLDEKDKEAAKRGV